MASLRTRVLASVLVLAAIGLVILAAVTYAEQSSFLENRLDREVETANPALSHELDRHGFAPGHTDTDKNAEEGKGDGDDIPDADNPPGTAPAGAPAVPPGTYAERKTAAGKLVGSLTFNNYGQKTLPHPLIPDHVPTDKLFTVGSQGSSGLRYRVYVHRDGDDNGLTLVAVALGEVEQTLHRLLLVEGLVIVGVLLALGASAYFVVRVGLRPLDRMEVTAGQIAAGELSHRVSPATEKTEVGRLGLALNEMLDRLEESFAERQASEDRLRQFLADASHELRTPLASIRGYAELFRMGATKDGDGTEMAMRRIEDESRRMGVLVEDLLTLARLDEAPEPTRAPVNLSVLAQDAVHDARATAPDRRITVSAPAAALVSGDSHQLRQVFANLMRNALVHTPAGSEIDVSIAGDERDVTVTVRDHGPGLPDTALANLFDRFWRAEGGRERGKAGAGLGLAIVSEVVSAHGGRVTASNVPGCGAEFVVSLPRATTVQPAPSAT
jgi:two-component system OmpR family sensor kinase